MQKNAQGHPIDFLVFMYTKYRGFVFYTLIMVAVLIVFESAQQYYYILQFDLAPTVQFSFVELIIAHGYRWIIWLVLTMAYFGTVIYNGKSDQIFDLTRSWPAIQHLVFLIGLNVIIISILQLAFADRSITFENVLDNCTFFFFQKAPIYTLAHEAMLGIFQMVNTNQNLAIEILDLKNQIHADDVQALSIKIGKKNKIIPLSDIVWIEAYDYCVKIHTTSQHTYAMRNSLKALEKKLQDKQFLRVHRKAIVNMGKVSEVTFNSSSFLTLDDQTKIDIAQSRISDVKGYLKTSG